MLDRNFWTWEKKSRGLLNNNYTTLQSVVHNWLARRISPVSKHTNLAKLAERIGHTITVTFSSLLIEQTLSNYKLTFIQP